MHTPNFLLATQHCHNRLYPNMFRHAWAQDYDEKNTHESGNENSIHPI